METTTFRLNLARTYINAMEILVEEEVDRRIALLTEGHRAYLNRMEIIAFALNKLPALYATGEKGLDYQLHLGRTQHAPRIQQAVQLSLAAVLRDPILNYTPLKLQAPAGIRDVMRRIQLLLHNEQLDWETLPDVLEALIKTTARGDQIAAVNRRLAHDPIANPTARRDRFEPSDDFDQDVTVGIPAAAIAPNTVPAGQPDRPWKKVRDRVGARASGGGASTAWDDTRYWQ
jgi:hypothetical protein